MEGKEENDFELEKSVSFNEALEQIGYGKYHLKLMGLAAIALIALTCEVSGMGFIAPAAKCDLNLTSGSQGILNGMNLLGVLLSSYFWGFCADIKGRRNILIWPSYLCFACTFFSSFAFNFWMLAILRFLAGICIGCLAGVFYAYFAEFHCVQHRSVALAWCSFFMPLCQLLMPFVAWIILGQNWEINLSILGITYKPWRLLLALFGLPNFLFATGLFLFPESPAFLAQTNEKKALQILGKMYACNKSKSTEHFKVKKLVFENAIEDTDLKSFTTVIKKVMSQTLPLFQPPYLWSMLMVSALFFGNLFINIGLYSWTPEMLNEIAPLESAHKSATFCQLYEMERANFSIPTNNDTELINCDSNVNESMPIQMIILGAPVCILSIFTTLFLNKIGKKNLVVYITLLCSLANIWFEFASTRWLRIALMSTFLFPTTTVSLIITYTADIFPTQYRALALSTSFTIGRLGGVIGSNIGGILLQISCMGTFYVFSALLLVCTFISLYLPGSTKWKICPSHYGAV